MRKMANAGKQSQIQIWKSLVKTVGPCIVEHRVVLGPAHTRRKDDWWWQSRFAAQHRKPSGRRRAILRQTSGHVAGLLKILQEAVKHWIEGFLSVRPMLEKMGDV